MNARLVLGIILILIGISTVIDFPFFNFLFAIFLVWLGYKVISGRESVKKTITTEKEIKRVLVFSSLDQKVSGESFSRGEIVAVFAGGTLDLSAVKTKNKRIELNLVAVFGGIKIIVPKSWSVKTEGIGILAGFDNKSQLAGKETSQLIVKGVSILGAVDIIN